jgi:hypothetical protein
MCWLILVAVHVSLLITAYFQIWIVGGIPNSPMAASSKHIGEEKRKANLTHHRRPTTVVLEAKPSRIPRKMITLTAVLHRAPLVDRPVAAI